MPLETFMLLSILNKEEDWNCMYNMIPIWRQYSFVTKTPV